MGGIESFLQLDIGLFWPLDISMNWILDQTPQLLDETRVLPLIAFSPDQNAQFIGLQSAGGESR
jgi:hypothetical protein